MENIDTAQDNMDLARLRRYDRSEAASKLNISPRWLRDWVTADVIPHQRKGEVRGVWFRYDDICEIGRMLPLLMSQRQANSRAEKRRMDAVSTETGGAQGRASATDDQVERFAGLRSLRADN